MFRQLDRVEVLIREPEEEASRRRKSVIYLTARKFVQTNLTGQLPR